MIVTMLANAMDLKWRPVVWINLDKYGNCRLLMWHRLSAPLVPDTLCQPIQVQSWMISSPVRSPHAICQRSIVIVFELVLNDADQSADSQPASLWHRFLRFFFLLLLYLFSFRFILVCSLVYFEKWNLRYVLHIRWCDLFCVLHSPQCPSVGRVFHGHSGNFGSTKWFACLNQPKRVSSGADRWWWRYTFPIMFICRSLIVSDTNGRSGWGRIANFPKSLAINGKSAEIPKWKIGKINDDDHHYDHIANTKISTRQRKQSRR